MDDTFSVLFLPQSAVLLTSVRSPHLLPVVARTRATAEAALANHGCGAIVSSLDETTFPWRELLAAAQAGIPPIPVVLLGRPNDAAGAVEAIKRGAADILLATAGHEHEIADCLGAALERQIRGAAIASSAQKQLHAALATQEIARAYDSTLEGWARALDLRDKETEGHSRRVTELSVRLAQRLGFSHGEIAHVRRGALLHDVGKLGIPDRILLKPGKLTDDEWAIMKLHPTYAFEWLAPIEYLRPALDIPHYHHERWDGTGYPDGLEAEAIPLAARIFAVVDVWDAMTNDRPYRAALPQEAVREHIRSQAGSHFDTHVVTAFLGL